MFSTIPIFVNEIQLKDISRRIICVRWHSFFRVDFCPFKFGTQPNRVKAKIVWSKNLKRFFELKGVAMVIASGWRSEGRGSNPGKGWNPTGPTLTGLNSDVSGNIWPGVATKCTQKWFQPGHSKCLKWLPSLDTKKSYQTWCVYNNIATGCWSNHPLCCWSSPWWLWTFYTHKYTPFWVRILSSDTYFGWK